MFKKIYLKSIELISNIAEEYLGIIILLSLLNYIGYGVKRYFFGKYTNSYIFIKIIKFLLGYFNYLFLVIGIFILLSFLPKIIKKVIFLLLIVVSFILAIIDLLLLLNFRSIIGNSVVQILFETNMNESIEFIKEYINITNILFLILLLVIFFLISKFKIKLRNNILKIIILILSIVQFFNLAKIIDNTPIARTIIATKESINNIKIYKKISENLNNNVEIKDKGKNLKNIILIIGESTSRNHMSLYNYNYKTNPLLEELEKQGNLYKFSDVIAPHAHTIPVLQKLLTFYNNDSTQEWYRYNNIVDIMKKSDYRTYWFSNQESFGIFGNVAAAIGNRCDVVVFNRIRDSKEEVFDSFDEEIVNKSMEYLNNKEKKFIVYHLLGTHSKYKYRYPKEYQYFNDNNYPVEKKEKEIVAEYDNAIRYNDYVIKKIIDLYAEEESIIFYMSDHGEEVFDFRNFVGHSEENPSRYMAEIPFIIYTSQKFKEKYPNVVFQIENSKENPYMIDDFIHTLLDITGIKINEFDERKSIINKEFNKSRKRIFSDKLYDNYWKMKN